MSAVQSLLYTFFISMVPVLELRASVFAGAAGGLHPLLTYAVAVCGNLVPIPFILLFIRHIFAWMRTWSVFHNLVEKLEARAQKKGDTVRKYGIIGLCILVAIPLPGTGAWTGALVAALMNMRLKRAMPAIILGVLIAGAVMTLLAYGIIS